MSIETLTPDDAIGCCLARVERLDDGAVARGTVIDAALAERLVAAGTETLLVARLDPDELHEDAAALTVARALAGTGTRAVVAGAGRVDLLATCGGLCCVERAAVVAANGVDDGIVVATVAEGARVESGARVAAVKIVPFGMRDLCVYETCLRLGREAVSVHAPALVNIALVQVDRSDRAEVALHHTARAVRERLGLGGGSLLGEWRCPNEPRALGSTLALATTRVSADIVLVLAASSGTDRGSVLGSAIETLGGRVERRGVPLCPGSRMLLGRLGDSVVIGLPRGALASHTGVWDAVFDRLLHALPLETQWLEGLCVGGLGPLVRADTLRSEAESRHAWLRDRIP